MIARPSTLSPRQEGSLALVRWANRPGYVAPTTERSLAALHRRGMVSRRDDPTRPGQSIWNTTAAGNLWIDEQAAARGLTFSDPPASSRSPRWLRGRA